MEKLKSMFGLLFCLILGVCIFLNLYIQGDTKEQRNFALIFSPLVIGFGIFTFIRDKRHKKSEEHLKEAITENQLFNSDAWRQRYIEYKEKHGFNEIDPKGMKADLIRHRRTLGTYSMTAVGAVCLGYFFYQVISGQNGHTDNFYALLPAGLLMFGGGLAYLLGFPVGTWIKKMGDKYKDIEDFYIHGQMVSEGLDGLNIGREYTVMFNETSIYFFLTKNIVNAGKKIVREREYNTGIYSSTTYKYNVFVQVQENDGLHTYEVTLNAFKAEMICEVLQTLLFHPDDFEIKYEETEAHDITIV